MSNDANQTPQPGRRREDAQRRSGARRPLDRARRRHGHGRLHIRRPSRKVATWSGAVLGLLVVALAILIAVWDWNWFRGPLARIASARMHREVTIDGDLKVHPFSWQPSATVEGVHIANPDWATPKAVGQARMADIGRIGVRIRLLPLLTGHLDLRTLRFDQPHVALLRDAQGRASWDFSDGRKAPQPTKLPPIRDFIVSGGQVSYRDLQKHLTFTGTLNASEERGAANHGFEMRGQGALNAEPFTVVVTGGPLLNIDRSKPYPFDAEIRAGRTYVTARGQVSRPFDLGHF